MMLGKNDVESGLSEPLYPTMLDNPELRWSFIRKVYSILSIQLLLTVAVAFIVVTFQPIAHFLGATTPGYYVIGVLAIIAVLVLIPLIYFQDKHPMNYLLLALFTVLLALLVGASCAFTSGKVILEAFLLTAVLVVSLTLYTFWAARRGHDFNFLGPFLFGVLIILLVFSLIQIFFPLGGIGEMIYDFLAAIIFCAYIVYDTDNLIKRYTYDQYIMASIQLYLDVVNIFMSLIRIFSRSED